MADGTFVNFLPLVGGRARRGDDRAAATGHDVVCRFFCIPQPAEEGLALARFLFAGYATVPVYEAFFRGLGWGDAIDPMVDAWRGGDRKGAAALAPEELLREIFVFGGRRRCASGSAAFAAAGITTLCLMPICGPDELPALSTRWGRHERRPGDRRGRPRALPLGRRARPTTPSTTTRSGAGRCTATTRSTSGSASRRSSPGSRG